MDKLETLLACLPPSDFKNIFTAEIEQLRQRVQELEERRCEVCGYAEHHREHTGCLREKVKELTAERDRLSELCDKWNFECDEMREDNERLANVVNAMKKAYESAEESVLALKETRNRLAEERDKATQYWQIAEGRCDALMKQRDELVAAIENCRLLAARHRKEEWATHILRFCVESGVIGSPIRDTDIASVKEKA